MFLKELSFANITDISAGNFNMVLSSERQLYVWGLGTFGDFYTPHRVKFFKDLNIQSFKVSNTGSAFVLTSEGALYSWGNNKNGQLGLDDHKDRPKPQLVEILEDKECI